MFLCEKDCGTASYSVKAFLCKRKVRCSNSCQEIVTIVPFPNARQQLCVSRILRVNNING